MSCEVLDFYAETCHKARKTLKRKCCECNQPIVPGERYAVCTGRMFSEYQHERCYHFARHVNFDLDWRDGDGCIEFGGIEMALQYRGEFDSVYIEARDEYEPSDLGKLWRKIKEERHEFRCAPDSYAAKNLANVFA